MQPPAISCSIIGRVFQKYYTLRGEKLRRWLKEGNADKRDHGLIESVSHLFLPWKTWVAPLIWGAIISAALWFGILFFFFATL